MVFNMIHRLAVFLFGITLALAQNGTNNGAGISNMVVVRPRSMTVDFWTADRMQAAKEPTFTVPPAGLNTGRSASVPTGPPVVVSAQSPDVGSPTSRVLRANGRQVLTNGRVFWACGNGLSSCSAGVIPSTSGDLIVTAAHCVFDTNTLRWLINCNWIFVPGYVNGTAPYGRWAAREAAVLNAWARFSPDYNYDVAFVALSRLNSRRISQVTGTQQLGFNQARNQLSYSFGYPVNLARGEVLQFCSGVPAASRYTAGGYRGQGLSTCLMTGGCSGGPWLQRFNVSTGIGITYSVNSFTYSLAPNTINGPMFDSNVQNLWNYMTNR